MRCGCSPCSCRTGTTRARTSGSSACPRRTGPRAASARGRSRCCRMSAAAWGPRKVDLPEWEKAPMWSRSRQLHDVDGCAAVSRRHLQAGQDHRGRAQAPRRPALTAVRSRRSTRSVPERALRSANRHGRLACHADRGMGARLQDQGRRRSPTGRRVRSRPAQRRRRPS